ncbi:hypothetical protein [Spirosoma endophyticum]|uniref:Uncharacterized protein n=1 Tax=Spirosoma endophyticum TaxID=662367 RepID=A0A1I1U6C1_9BACT|nr:hypothetical protein [Spirosoma endophyticum]SFD66319.1 hypothetical protein SAMN05216167_106142 [Spirosoma endophyticum]
MSNVNKILYFVAQTYRQIQISVAKGVEPYTYGDFNRQFNRLLEASDEEHAKQLSMLLTEEASQHNLTVDYLRQEMEFEIRAAELGNRTQAALDDNQPDLYDQRMKRSAK